MLGLPSLLLMENAGRGVAEIVRRELAVRPGGERPVRRGLRRRHRTAATGSWWRDTSPGRGSAVRVLLVGPRAKVARATPRVMLGALERMGGVPIEEGGDWTG